MIPANNGTYVITNSDGLRREPVIGWGLDDNRPVPMTLDGRRRMIDCAIEFPCGLVVGSDGVVYGSASDWLAASEKPKPTPTPRRPAAPVEAPKPTTASSIVSFAGKVYQQKTFWRYTDSAQDFVFVLEPGQSAPVDDEVTKIKRDEYFLLRKEIAERKMSDLMSGEPQTESFEDEDDDSGDLV